jgi:hypothetical protein
MMKSNLVLFSPYVIYFLHCSRTKNIMWYGMLGGKELLQKTFKNLDERVQLECDGQRIPLPSLQGIVVLNIVSYGGGTNFWGGTKEDDVSAVEPPLADTSARRTPLY